MREGEWSLETLILQQIRIWCWHCALAAGLDGIKNKIQPDAELRENVFELTEQDKKRLGIESLPADLHEAVECLKSDDFIREILGEHIYNKFIEAKEAEWNDYRAAVTQWEIDEYLYKF